MYRVPGTEKSTAQSSIQRGGVPGTRYQVPYVSIGISYRMYLYIYCRRTCRNGVTNPGVPLVKYQYQVPVSGKLSEMRSTCTGICIVDEPIFFLFIYSSENVPVL